MSERKLTLGIIFPQFPTYTETFFLSQVIGFCEKGHQVYVFCNTINPDKTLRSIYQLEKIENLRLVSFDFSNLSLSVLKNIFTNPFVFFRHIRMDIKNIRRSVFNHLCKSYFLKYRCDIYHFGYSGIALSYLNIFDAIPGKKIVSCLGTAENVKLVTEKGRTERLVKLFQKADSIHCISYAMKEKISHLAVHDNKIFVNQPAIDTCFFSRKRFQTSNQKVLILSVGRLVFQKGYMTGLLAMAELKKSYPNFEWLIAGEGPEWEELSFTIHLLKLETNVTLIGKKTKPEILDLYEQASIFFLPSVSEGIANVVLEAMSMQLPVVSSDCGGLSEVINHNVNGILCKSYDFKKMGSELSDLCLDVEKRRRLGTEARKLIEENFDVKRYISVFEQEYSDLIK